MLIRVTNRVLQPFCLCLNLETPQVRVTVGVTGAANVDVTQLVEVMSDEAAKQSWLMQHLQVRRLAAWYGAIPAVLWVELWRRLLWVWIV